MDTIINDSDFITVLLPVYNSEKFLKLAIDSILNQTHTHFELLIINDGSTDNSLSIITAYQDPRIRLSNNEVNKGLIYTLNKGIDLAKGKWIARMDADDIALPERLEVQLDYFKRYPEVALVCSPIIPINEMGLPAMPWKADANNRTATQIKTTLAKENCIAHPSVIIKSEIAKVYKYNPKQIGSEDWDLWMRLVADGHTILKTEAALLKYRYLATGITFTDRKKQLTDVKVIKVKYRFFIQRLGQLKIRAFEFQVLYSLFRAILRHLKINIFIPFLRKTKHLLTISPLKSWMQFKKLNAFCEVHREVQIFFLFPYCHIGGAEKVHANITEVFADQKILTLFTGISNKEDFLFLFEKIGPSFNIGHCLNHPFFQKQSERLILELIASNHKAIVFGCNNHFFYDHILKFKSDIRVFDLLHDYTFEALRSESDPYLEHYKRCEKRIFISAKALAATKKMYAATFMEPKVYEKLVLIPNRTDLPNEWPMRSFQGPLKILFVGRGTPEKRANLFEQIADRCCDLTKNESEKILFTAIGDLSTVIKSKNVNLVGPLSDYDEILPYYHSYHIIVITSLREGFPLVLMEGMANGMSCLSTPVGDVPVHVSETNGYVTKSLEAENVLSEMTAYVLAIRQNRLQLKSKSEFAYHYAKSHFSKAAFYKAYRNVVYNENALS